MNLDNEEVILQVASPGWWRTMQPIDYDVFGKRIVVPAQFVTDLASVPRALWAIIPPFGNYTAAAVVHDWLYSVQQVDGERITRKWADDVFLQGMTDLQVRWTRRQAMYRAVRAFGWAPWRRKVIVNVVTGEHTRER